ncbi:MAG TPA: 3-hydroxyacyl-CoA dehydrogenase family protein [Flavitalea sp.]|nr:3-hydroxyacyl-CoA dehydrogenase family protein [Flavitalea sp.]
MDKKSQVVDIEVGVVGLGLMGSSIVVSLLLAGHKVKAIAPRSSDMELAKSRILDQYRQCTRSGIYENNVDAEEIELDVSEDYSRLKHCQIVFECVIEDIQIKAAIYTKIASEVRHDAIIATNTSAIAITTLQGLVSNPERFLGIHWAEPAYATRFMEITCGEQTCVDYAEWIFKIAHYWNKEPTLLRKDIRGFITNRLMYAVYREIFSLVEAGRVTMEDADKAFRYDAGSWITMMGIFRRMDYTGLVDWMAILQSVLPTLSNSAQVPQVMQNMVDSDARGIQNQKGLYSYTEKEAKEWDEAFALFNKDIFELAALYPSVKTELHKEKQRAFDATR